MNNILVDLHMHSYASDGTDTPTQLLQKAKDKDIGLISLTDHNSLANSKEIRQLAKKYNISVIDGVEIDASYNGLTYHILGYGIDTDNVEFKNFMQVSKNKLKSVNNLLIERMCPDFPQLNYDEFLEYSYDRTNGGWESLNYLLEKGITSSLKDGFAYHAKYNCTIKGVDFPSCATTINQIHRAGGYAVLAHPGEYSAIYDDDSKKVDSLLEVASSIGIDGIECYHYKHDEYTTGKCVDFCRKNSLIITGGCDYHGEFISVSEIGKIKITMDMLSLGSLNKKIII